MADNLLSISWLNYDKKIFTAAFPHLCPHHVENIQNYSVICSPSNFSEVL